MTAIENVLVGMHSRLKASLFNSILRTPGVRARGARGARARAASCSSYTGLRRQWQTTAKNLPYGDQRRLEVARALATEPQLLLLDEPTAGMNPQESAEFTAFVGDVRDERGLTVLMIEHDMRVVMGVSDRVSVLDYGEKIAEGHAARGAAGRARDRGLPRQGRRRGHEAAGARRDRERERRGEPILELDGRPHLLRLDPRAEGHLARGARRARSSRCSARTAPASRRRCARSTGSTARARERSASRAATSPACRRTRS